jgi:carotenoid cleavage dioxygenase-like enzyme
MKCYPSFIATKRTPTQSQLVTPTTQVRRYVVDLDAAADQRAVIGGSVRAELLCDIPCEFPRINYDSHNARPYRYLYGAGPPIPDMLPQGESGQSTACVTFLIFFLNKKRSSRGGYF